MFLPARINVVHNLAPFHTEECNIRYTLIEFPNRVRLAVLNSIQLTMLRDDIEIELKIYRDTLVLAKRALANADYADSERRYTVALAKARDLFSAKSPEVASCLLGLANSHYA